MYITLASIMNPKPRSTAQEPEQPPAPQPLILDTYNAYVAYSFRKLKTDYVGDSVRIINSANVEEQFGLENGYVNRSDLLTHIGSDFGRIVTKFDQSGNGRDWTQADPAKQPFIAKNGSLIEVDGFISAHHESTSVLQTANFSTYTLGENILDLSVVQVPSENGYFAMGASGITDRYYGVSQSGSTNTATKNFAGNPSLYVNNSLINDNRGDYHTAITGDLKKLVAVSDLSMHNWTSIWSKYPSESLLPVTNQFEKILFTDSLNRAEKQNNVNAYYNLF